MCVTRRENNIFDVQKKKKKHGIYSIELICLNGCLGSYLKLNGKFQFNSLIHCWAFCLKSWKKKKEKWYLAVPDKSRIACLEFCYLGWIAYKKNNKEEILG